MKLQLLVFISTFTYSHHYISLLVITTQSFLKFLFLKKLNIMHSAIIFGNTLQICDFNQPALLSKKEQFLKQKSPVDSQHRPGCKVFAIGSEMEVCVALLLYVQWFVAMGDLFEQAIILLSVLLKQAFIAK